MLTSTAQTLLSVRPHTAHKYTALEGHRLTECKQHIFVAASTDLNIPRATKHD